MDYFRKCIKRILSQKRCRFYSLLFLFLLSSANVFAQDTISYALKSQHSPRKAALMSTFLPGLGQAYNRQYYKIPILYAGLATLTYFYINNNNNFKSYRDEYLHRINGDTALFNPSYKNYSTTSIQKLREYYQNNLELTVIIGVVVYLLNIVDASVYAHLFSFDVSDNLTLGIKPDFNYSLRDPRSLPGASFSIKFKF